MTAHEAVCQDLRIMLWIASLPAEQRRFLTDSTVGARSGGWCGPAGSLCLYCARKMGIEMPDVVFERLKLLCSEYGVRDVAAAVQRRMMAIPFHEREEVPG